MKKFLYHTYRITGGKQIDLQVDVPINKLVGKYLAIHKYIFVNHDEIRVSDKPGYFVTHIPSLQKLTPPNKSFRTIKQAQNYCETMLEEVPFVDAKKLKLNKRQTEQFLEFARTYFESSQEVAKSKESVWVVPYNVESQMVLIAKRATKMNNGELWNFFGGGVEKGESSKKAAMREFYEEAGIKLNKSALKKLGANNVTTISNRFQSHYYMLETDTNFSPKLNKENSKFKWVSIHSLEKIKNVHHSISGFYKFLFQLQKEVATASFDTIKYNSKSHPLGSSQKIKMTVNGDEVASALVFNVSGKLLDFYVKQEYRRKGYATEFLKYLVSEAGVNNLLAIPTPDSEDAISMKKLVKFYEQTGGFKVVKRLGNSVAMALPNCRYFGA